MSHSWLVCRIYLLRRDLQKKSETKLVWWGRGRRSTENDSIFYRLFSPPCFLLFLIVPTGLSCFPFSARIFSLAKDLRGNVFHVNFIFKLVIRSDLIVSMPDFLIHSVQHFTNKVNPQRMLKNTPGV